MTSPEVRFEPVEFADLPGWVADDHQAAFHTFAASAARLPTPPPATTNAITNATTNAIAAALRQVADRALADASRITSPTAARRFFEQHFAPHRLIHSGPPGLLTGYYEPIVEGARTPSAAFPVPIYRRPPDLVNLVEEAARGTVGATLTHARRTPIGLVPYATRADIEAGALAGQNLELFYLPDPIQVFFLQVQGSGIIALRDGTRVRVTYDGKNGHPYTSIGRILVEQGAISAADMSLETLAAWLRADPARARQLMQRNESYVFFRPLSGRDATAPIGVHDIPLTAGRSLAVDTTHHAIGLPIYIASPVLTHATPTGGFHRLMVAHDVGSAIKGPERGDIFFGSGPAAAMLAGITKHEGTFFALLPHPVGGADPSGGAAS